MSNLSPADKQFLDNALRLDTGFIVRFNREAFADFFKNFNVDIYEEKYADKGYSMTNRIHSFWEKESNKLVALTLLELAALFRNRELSRHFNVNFSHDIEKIAQKLMLYPSMNIESNELMKEEKINVNNEDITIIIRPEIYEHIKEFLKNNDYYHSVEESYKIVREKLKNLTGDEQAHKAFCDKNIKKIFGHIPQNDSERDFIEGVKFLNMAIQNFRNEKAHTPAKPLDKNQAMHYIVLASLAYELISKNQN